MEKPDVILSKDDPDVMEKLLQIIDSSDSKTLIENEAKESWAIIEKLDKKHSDTNHPYSDREIKVVTKLANNMMHLSKHHGFGDLADELFNVHAKLFFNPEKFSDVEKVIAVNRIKDIFHQIYEPRFSKDTKTEKKDLTIKGFPTYSKGKDEYEYKKVYEKRLFWFYDILKETKGENFADALLTMDHDLSEFSLNIARYSWDYVIKEKTLDKAVEKKLITEKQRLQILELIIYCFATKTITDRDDPDWEKKSKKIETPLLRKIIKLDKRCDDVK